MRTTIFFALVAVTVTAASDDGILSSNGDDPDKTGKLYEVIGDFVDNHDKVVRQRFAMVSTGKKVDVRPGRGGTVMPLWHITAHEGNNRLFASALAVPSNLRPEAQMWIQEFHDGKTIHRRYQAKDTIVFANADERNEKEKQFVAELDPIYQSLCGPNTLLHRGTSKNQGPDLLKYELQEAKYTKEGNISATLIRYGRDAEFVPANQTENKEQLYVVFGVKSGFMPIEIRHSLKPDKRIIPNPKMLFLSHVTTEWKRHKTGVYLPTGFVGTTFDPLSGNERSTYAIGYNWAIGDEVPENTLDVSAHDWRESSRKLLDAKWNILSPRYPLLE